MTDIASIISIGGYVIAAMTLSFAFVLWRKSNKIYGVLVEAMARNEALELNATQQKAALADLKETQSKRSRANHRIEKSLDQYKSEAESLSKEISELKQTFELSQEKDQAQIERYSTEVRALTKQLVTIDQDHRIQKSAYEKQSKATIETLRQELSITKDTSEKNARDLHKARQSGAKLREILTKVDPKDTARIKRKIKQFEQFFVILKGQKEMAEELSSNWETALRRTATWIIQNSKPQGHQQEALTVPKKIGPLVGAALEIVGGHLIEGDEFNHHASSPKTKPPLAISDTASVTTQSSVPVSADEPKTPSSIEFHKTRPSLAVPTIENRQNSRQNKTKKSQDDTLKTDVLRAPLDHDEPDLERLIADANKTPRPSPPAEGTKS